MTDPRIIDIAIALLADAIFARWGVEGEVLFVAGVDRQRAGEMAVDAFQRNPAWVAVSARDEGIERGTSAYHFVRDAKAAALAKATELMEASDRAYAERQAAEAIIDSYDLPF